MRIRIPFLSKKYSKKQLELLDFVFQRFGYKPNNLDLFEKALTHRSIINSKIQFSNERLEFLGDSILDAVLAEYLYERFPDEDEGYLTKIKSKVVSRKTLAVIAESMELRNVIHYNRGRSINIATIEGNAFEAIIGAIYLDGGFLAVKKSFHQHIFLKYMDFNRILEEEIDFKSKLFIWSQKKRLQLEFLVLDESNSNNVWEYTIAVKINDTLYGQGKGSTKKAAEQAASKETLELMGEI